MKQYLVAYVILSVNVEETFENEADAKAFAEIMNRRHPERHYTVFKMLEGIEGDK